MAAGAARPGARLSPQRGPGRRVPPRCREGESGVNRRPARPRSGSPGKAAGGVRARFGRAARHRRRPAAGGARPEPPPFFRRARRRLRRAALRQPSGASRAPGRPGPARRGLPAKRGQPRCGRAPSPRDRPWPAAAAPWVGVLLRLHPAAVGSLGQGSSSRHPAGMGALAPASQRGGETS